MSGAEWAVSALVVLVLALFGGLTYLVRLQHEIDRQRDGARELDELEGDGRIERCRRQIGARELEEWQEQIRDGHR